MRLSLYQLSTNGISELSPIPSSQLPLREPEINNICLAGMRYEPRPLVDNPPLYLCANQREVSLLEPYMQRLE